MAALSHPFSNAPCTARLHEHARHVLQDLAQKDSTKHSHSQKQTGLKNNNIAPQVLTINLPCLACAVVLLVLLDILLLLWSAVSCQSIESLSALNALISMFGLSDSFAGMPAYKQLYAS